MSLECVSRRALAAALLCSGAAGCDARAQGAPDPLAGQSPVPVAVPVGWSPLPEVAAAGKTAAADAAGDRAIEVRSWGEPSLGCFVTVVEVTGTRDEHLAKMAESLRVTLDAALDLDGWTFTDGPVAGKSAEVSATIAGNGLRGALRGKLVAEASRVPHAAVAACFYNDRDPARCQPACTALLASLETPRVVP